MLARFFPENENVYLNLKNKLALKSDSKLIFI